MRAVLHGGPVDRRVIDDVTDETQNIKIPAGLGPEAKYAHYQRVGSGIDQDGMYLRFDFTNVYQADGRPMAHW